MTKVLLVNEYSGLKSGYGVYGREIGLRLADHFELAELSCYLGDGENHHNDWQIFPNIPLNREGYHEDTEQVFGAKRFEEVCLKFQPDVVIAFRDPWMDRFIIESPYKHCFKMVWMPTVDGFPQRPEWVDLAKKVEAVLSYQDWSGDILKREKLNYLGSAPPVGSDAFKPNQKEIRDVMKMKLGLPPGSKVVGTVMRNQKRKLFDDLFFSFSEFSSRHPEENYILYCHTTFPDQGWDLPELLKTHSLSSKVYFTMQCRNCKIVTAEPYRDPLCVCPHCHNKSLTFVSIRNGLDDENLNHVYNTLDVYVQYSHCEGFGIPQIEAKQAGVPVIGLNYSASEDILTSINGIPVEPLTYLKEIETGRYFAIANNNALVKALEDVLINESFDKSSNFKAKYNWDKTSKVWIEAINKVGLGNWKSPPRIFPVAEFQELEQLSPSGYARWLIDYVLGDQSLRYSLFEQTLIRNLTWNCVESNSSKTAPYKEFKRQDAYNMCRSLANFRNHHESIRQQYLGL